MPCHRTQGFFYLTENLVLLGLRLYYFEQVKEQLSREPRAYPKVTMNPEKKSVFDFVYDDFDVEGYNPHPRISAPVAI